VDLALNEGQRLLRESVERFVEKEYAFAARRQLAASEEGFSREVWATFAELGWLAAPLPEDHGGLGGDDVDVAVIMEGFGRGLVLEPYLSTVVLGGGLIAAGGSEAQRAALLPPLAEGKLLLALAHAEPGGRYDLAHVETRAEKDGQGFRLSGRKAVVFHAASADKIVVPARTAGGVREADGITLFLLDRQSPGLALRAYPTVDGLRAAELTLDGARAGAEEVIGATGAGLPLLELAVDRGITAVSAEAAGAMAALVAATREHLQTRKQFGVPLAGFQVLQHRVVDMFMAHELTRALAFRAAAAMDDPDPRARGRAASAAKVQTGKAGRFVGQEAVQLHGGMGMTEELPVGHYFKRLSMIGTLFGDADHHLRRFAELDPAAA